MPKRKQHRTPKANSIFEREYLGKTYRMRVIETQQGVAYEVGGHKFRSPTAAARSLVKYHINGWRFWKMEE